MWWESSAVDQAILVKMIDAEGQRADSQRWKMF
jgi:hypothetical protein